MVKKSSEFSIFDFAHSAKAPKVFACLQGTQEMTTFEESGARTPLVASFNVPDLTFVYHHRYICVQKNCVLRLYHQRILCHSDAVLHITRTSEPAPLQFLWALGKISNSPGIPFLIELVCLSDDNFQWGDCYF